MNLLPLAAAVAACLVAPAFADPLPSPRTETVRFADLDLGRARDLAILEQRIRAAAASACGPSSAADLAGDNKALRCRREAIAQARTALRPMLAASARSKRGQIAVRR